MSDQAVLEATVRSLLTDTTIDSKVAMRRAITEAMDRLGVVVSIWDNHQMFTRWTPYERAVSVMVTDSGRRKMIRCTIVTDLRRKWLADRRRDEDRGEEITTTVLVVFGIAVVV